MMQSGAAMLYVVRHSCRATLLRPPCMRLSAVAHPCLSSALTHTAAGERHLDHAGAVVVRGAHKRRAAASTNGRYAADTTAVYRRFASR
jgi:hypothetical protein